MNASYYKKARTSILGQKNITEEGDFSKLIHTEGDHSHFYDTQRSRPAEEFKEEDDGSPSLLNHELIVIMPQHSQPPSIDTGSASIADVTEDEEEREKKRRQMYREVVNRAEENMLKCTAERFVIAQKHWVSYHKIDGVEGDTGYGCDQVLEAYTSEEQGEQRRSERL